MCSGVLVGQVQRVARELDAAAGSALHEVGILMACKERFISHFLTSRVGACGQPYERSPR